MQTTTMMDSSRWPVATFPSRGQRQEFLEQARIWNKVEGLPRIETAPMTDGISLRFFSSSPYGQTILRLIHAFGGFVSDRLA